MNYEFDIVSTIPADIQRKYTGIFERFNMTDIVQKPTAIFREQATVDALFDAPEAIWNCFVDSGFNLLASADGTQNASATLADAEARNQVLDRLKENVAALPEDTDWNGFDIAGVFKAAYPVSDDRKARRFKPVEQSSGLKRMMAVTSRYMTRPVTTPVSPF